MGLPNYAQLPCRDEQSSFVAPTPRWISMLPLLLLLPLISTNPLDKLFPPAPPAFIKAGLEQCAAFDLAPPSFSASRSRSDRFVPGTKTVLLTNGTIWTGNENGSEIIYGGSVLLENGLIKKVGSTAELLKSLTKSARAGIKEIDLEGNWVTPGIVDNHSHLGVYASPGLNGASDGNSHLNPILPFLRSIDGLNTHDQAYNLTISGGVTTALVLPGSANNIGGQAFVIKPRQTTANTPSSMVVENPWQIAEGGGLERTGAPRHIKHACGENIHGLYGHTRMDQAYSFRTAYASGAALKDKQDAWCAKGVQNTEPFPQDLQWEALADVIRGNVKVQVHCYETVDLDQLVRLTNEFKFSISAVHHAHEAWLVPDLLKKAYKNTPAAAIFAISGRYKREAFRGSEYAPKILAEAGVDVVMKSDHPVLDSRYLIFEAAQAHYYGLNASLALASVTTVPAKVIGKDHRLGYLRDNYDADVVVWDAHPLTLGATPKQVYIDGIPMLEAPFFNPTKPANLQKVPVVPDFGDEAEIHKQARGDPDYAALLERKSVKNVIFTNVKEVFVKQGPSLVSLVEETSSSNSKIIVVVEDGKIICSGACATTNRAGFTVIDLKGGSIIPGLLSYGAPLGLVEISSEVSTQDGAVVDGLASGVPPVLQDQVIRAADGASFATKDALIATKFGVTKGVTAPSSRGGLISGLSFVFSTSAATPLSPGAILQEVAALHVTVGHGGSPYSISTQISMLRKLLLGKTPDEEGWWKKAASGELPLVVTVEKADIIARLLVVKKEIEFETGKRLKLVISGGTEAHLIAADLASASVGVIMTRSRSYPAVWDSRRILAGPPLTQHSPIDALISAGVLVGLGSVDSPTARNTRIEAGWTALGSSSLSTKDALALVSTNLEKLLGVKPEEEEAQARDWVAVEGEIFGFEGKVVARGGGEGVSLM